MTRKEILKRLGFTVPSEDKIRMIVDTDAGNEADDQFAIMHHLLTPSFDVRGIIATHFERKPGNPDPGITMEKSYAEILEVLQLAEIDDAPAFKGCVFPLASIDDAPESESSYLYRCYHYSDPCVEYVDHIARKAYSMLEEILKEK